MKRDVKGRFVSEKKQTEEKVYASGYKGFDKGLICRDKQYKENTVFEEPSARICEFGMHFCKNPLDVFNYYPPSNGREYARVDALATCKTEDDKSCTTKLRINAKISVAGLCSAAVDFVLSKIDNKKKQQVIYSDGTGDGYSATINTGDRSVANNTGVCSAATNTGNNSVATNVGYRSAATNTGGCSAVTNTGYHSASTNTGYHSASTNTGARSAAINTGDRSVATNTGFQSVATNTGYHSAAVNAGNRSVAANTGDQSVASNTGYYSVATNTGVKSAATVDGKESFAISTGFDGRVKGALGCFLACAEWIQDISGDWHPIRFIAGKVDGDKIKPDTWYTVRDGKFVEAE